MNSFSNEEEERTQEFLERDSRILKKIICLIEIALYSWIGVSMAVYANDSLSKETLTPISATMWYSIGSVLSYIILSTCAMKMPPIKCQRDPPIANEEIGSPSLIYLARNGIGALLTFSSMFLQFLLIKKGGVLVSQVSWAMLPIAYVVSSKIFWTIEFAYEKQLGFVTDGLAAFSLLCLLIIHPTSWWVSLLWIIMKSQSIMLDSRNRMVSGDDPALSMFWNMIGTSIISFLIVIQMQENMTEIKNSVIPAMIMFAIGIVKGILFLVFDAQRLAKNSDGSGPAWKSNVRMGITGIVIYIRCFETILPIEFVFFCFSFLASVGNRILRKRGVVEEGEENEYKGEREIIEKIIEEEEK